MEVRQAGVAKGLTKKLRRNSSDTLLMPPPQQHLTASLGPNSPVELVALHCNCGYKIPPPQDCGLKQELYLFISMPLTPSTYEAQAKFDD